MIKSRQNSYLDDNASFQWSRPEKYNFARDVIDVWAEDRKKSALMSLDDTGQIKERTFAQISEQSMRLCNVLSAAGIKRGDTIILVLGRNIEWWEVLTAALRMGVVVSPGTTQLSSKDIAYRINSAEATCLITDQQNGLKFDIVQEQCPTIRLKLLVADSLLDGWINYQNAVKSSSAAFDTVDTLADEEALCFFTSGTTGHPKMTIHTHSYGIGHQTTGKYWLDLKPSDLHWNISDTGWAKAAWSSYFGPWNQGATLFIHNSNAFDAKQTLQILDKYPITTMCGAPTIYRMLVLEDLSPYDFSSLRHCVGAGEPLNPEVIEVWRKATGLIIRDGYGQTESTILCGNFVGVEPRFGSMGKPSPGVDLQIIDEGGSAVASNTEGDIAVKVTPHKPQGLFKEYRNDPGLTAKCFRGDWYLTGDRAYIDDDGYFWFVGRDDDVIISAGYRIGPFEVESALLEHEAVAESAVVSSPDQERGAVVKAFVVLTAGCHPSDELVQELQNHVKALTAPYKYPRKIEFLDQLPKTVSGKIRRIELRESEW